MGGARAQRRRRRHDRSSLLVRVEAHGVEPDGRKHRSTAGRRRRSSGSSGCCARPGARRPAHHGRRDPPRLRAARRDLRLAGVPDPGTGAACRSADPRRPEAAARPHPPLRRADANSGSRRCSSARARRRPRSRQSSPQVLGALHELLRGLLAAERTVQGQPRHAIWRANDPHHLYEGLLTVLLRLVFLLYAEDRDLIPSRTEKEARWLYDQGYSVARPLSQRSPRTRRSTPTRWTSASAPGRSSSRCSAWSTRRPAASGCIRAAAASSSTPTLPVPRRPRTARHGSAAPSWPVPDGSSAAHPATSSWSLDGERISYRALDVEQIGSVYETMMGFRSRPRPAARWRSRPAEEAGRAGAVDLEALLREAGGGQARQVAPGPRRPASSPRRRSEGGARAATLEDLHAALAGIVDERGSPSGGRCRRARWCSSRARSGAARAPTTRRARSPSRSCARARADPRAAAAPDGRRPRRSSTSRSATRRWARARSWSRPAASSATRWSRPGRARPDQCRSDPADEDEVICTPAGSSRSAASTASTGTRSPSTSPSCRSGS